MEGTNGYPSQVFVAYAVARPPFSPFARVWGRYEPVGEGESGRWFLVLVTYPGVEQSLSVASLERIPSPGMREYARGFRLAFTSQPRVYGAHEGESIPRCTACAAILWLPEEFGYAFCGECVGAEEGGHA